MVAKIYGTAIVLGVLAAIPAAYAGGYDMQRGITDGSPYPVINEETTRTAGVAGPSGEQGLDASDYVGVGMQDTARDDQFAWVQRQLRISDGFTE